MMRALLYSASHPVSHQLTLCAWLSRFPYTYAASFPASLLKHQRLLAAEPFAAPFVPLAAMLFLLPADFLSPAFLYVLA